MLQGSTTVENIAIGCGHNNEGLFVGAAVLIGLGSGRISFPSQINATSYSYYSVVDHDSNEGDEGVADGNRCGVVLYLL
ncbi:putative nepenthesin [Helianthus debilis subsp. tardiflorus]